MRRMLDPKTIGGGGGGGGDEKLYRHCIYFNDGSNSKGGKITLDYYSKKKDRFTYETFKKEFSDNRHVACGGYIHDGDNYFTVFYLELSGNPFIEIYARYMDTVHNIFNLTKIINFTLQDSVSEVN